jgi:hypothetical protein
VEASKGPEDEFAQAVEMIRKIEAENVSGTKV